MANLLDEENETFGINIYNEKIEDPQATNALNSSIINEMKTIIQVEKIFLIAYFKY